MNGCGATADPAQASQTSSEFVAALVQALRARDIEVWLDGGLGVDALLHRETRPHEDVDIVLEERHVPEVVALLQSWKFAPVARDDTRAWNFVFGDTEQRLVDMHVVVFDADGRGIYGPRENGQFYPAAAFAGRGSVANVEVKCMTVDFQIANRTGYVMRSKDHHDLRVLRAAFPPEQL